ncbi:hypothetical protein BGZ99_010080 [Dissophora globulifera]|uniref:Methyltransferase domain-containing protein n=1 Tax=Dissophora globulifera TaxID=979702 RepID=A0A9P6UML0_9FUNG|nr:hypothetical protein BGZ99_010080 [Dissophora globulifera]
MGNSVSSLNNKKVGASREVAAGDLAYHSHKKLSLFQRSRSTLQFRKRSKAALSDTNVPSSSSLQAPAQYSTNARLSHTQVVPNRHDSFDLYGNSDRSNLSVQSNSTHFTQNQLQQLYLNNSNGSSNNSLPAGNLPEWAHPPRRLADGRTRHTVESAPYMLPNDLTESDRLDGQHYLCRFVFKGNFNVKLDHDKPLKILDVATGTGVWALEMAHEFPNAEVYGVDISAIFPTEIKPSNCHFQLCNILDGLPFPDNYFDFIYQRLLVYALTPAQRRQVYIELQRILKPEGFLQLVESDGIVYNPGPETEMINQLSLETSLRHGVDPREVQNMKSGLKHAGYTGVNSFNIALPNGQWGGKAGALSLQNMHGLATIWLKGEVGKMDQEACDAILKVVDEECERLQSYYKVWLVVGQKPAQKEIKKAVSTSVLSISNGNEPQPAHLLQQLQHPQQKDAYEAYQQYQLYEQYQQQNQQQRQQPVVTVSR